MVQGGFPRKGELTKGRCFPALSSSVMSWLFLSVACLLRLSSFTYFPAFTTGFTFSRACHWLHVFPRLPPVSHFPALATGFIFSRACCYLPIFPRFMLVACCCLSSDWFRRRVRPARPNPPTFTETYRTHLYCCCDHFLYHFFQDKGMSYFFEHGRFPADRFEFPRKSKNLVVVVFWNIILCLPLVWYFISLIFSGSIASLLTAATIALVGKLHQDFINSMLIYGLRRSDLPHVNKSNGLTFKTQ